MTLIADKFVVRVCLRREVVGARTTVQSPRPRGEKGAAAVFVMASISAAGRIDLRLPLALAAPSVKCSRLAKVGRRVHRLGIWNRRAHSQAIDDMIHPFLRIRIG